MSESWYHKAKHLEEVTHKCSLCNEDLEAEECSDCYKKFEKDEEIICINITCQGQYETHEDKGAIHLCITCAKESNPEATKEALSLIKQSDKTGEKHG